MPKYTKTQQCALELLRVRLDPRHPLFTADHGVAKALDGIRPYMDTWVTPLVDTLLGNEPYKGFSEQVRRDHHARIASRTGK